ncbi:MAG: hypothetical protein AAF441_23425 [Pseudomonadota bacterium]
MAPDDLEERLLRAHDRNDGESLAALYAEAADLSERSGRIDEACFRYTQAQVYALEHGQTELAARVRAKLLSYGREE